MSDRERQMPYDFTYMEPKKQSKRTNKSPGYRRHPVSPSGGGAAEWVKWVNQVKGTERYKLPVRKEVSHGEVKYRDQGQEYGGSSVR